MRITPRPQTAVLREGAQDLWPIGLRRAERCSAMQLMPPGFNLQLSRGGGINCHRPSDPQAEGEEDEEDDDAIPGSGQDWTKLGPVDTHGRVRTARRTAP